MSKFSCVVHLLLVLLLHCVGPGHGKSDQDENPTRMRLSEEPVLLVVSFDGFRYNYFDRINATNMDYLKKTGVSVPYMRNQFITKTFPNHQSIATGLYVESHGITDNWLYDPLYETYVGYSNGSKFWKYSDEILPLWTVNQMAGGNRSSGCMMWPGGDMPYGPNNVLPDRVLSWKESMPFSDRVDTVISWLTDTKKPANVVFMYFEQPDESAHAFGPEGPEVTRQIEVADETTGYLVKRLQDEGIFDHVNLIVLSDHGFAPVPQNHIINVSAIVGLDASITYPSSPLYPIFPKKQEDADVIYEKLADFAKQQKTFQVFKKDEILKSWHYGFGRRIPPILAVANLTYVFDDFYPYMLQLNHKFNITANGSHIYGTHGYDNHNIKMHPFFVAHGPVFPKSVVVDPFDNVDLFPLMCQILNLKAPPNNGTIGHVTSLLKQSYYTLKNPVMWVLAAGLVLGIVILTGILSVMITRKKQDLPFGVLENGYRYVSKEELLQILDDDDCDDDTETHMDKPYQNGVGRYASDFHSDHIVITRGHSEKISTAAESTKGDSEETEALLRPFDDEV